MPKKTGLGRGLDALFAENKVPEEEKIRPNEIVQNIKLIEIEPNTNQPRRNFEEESLQELASSIKRYGVIQPIIVTPKDGYYQIVAGERRWRASKIAEMTEIPAIVREDDERRNKEISLIENIQREDLNPIEKARGIKTLIDEYELTQEKAAEILGMKRSTVANTIRLLNLDGRVMKLAEEGKLTEGHCKALMAIADGETQYNMALYIIETGGTVRDLEKRMQVKKNIKKKESNRTKKFIFFSF